jgi:hypothetical protein
VKVRVIKRYFEHSTVQVVKTTTGWYVFNVISKERIHATNYDHAVSIRKVLL